MRNRKQRIIYQYLPTALIFAVLEVFIIYYTAKHNHDFGYALRSGVIGGIFFFLFFTVIMEFVPYFKNKNTKH